jgi:DNA-binding winged helix-turn-helix (wHTH) protein/tetratricopeptide (TPR) repeat protein
MSEVLPPPGATLPIDLSRQAPFRLGATEVRPATLEVLQGRDREVLEPRVMQVLTALYLANGQVVSRDALIAQCWEGRVVSDDAINRAIGRLRRLAEAGAAFSIETVPRVGYRLVAGDISGPVPAAREPVAAPGLGRRSLLLYGGLTAAAAMAGAAAYRFWPTPAPPAASPRIAAMLARAWTAWRGNRATERAQAISLYQALTVEAPNSAEAWGGLAASYADATRNDNPAKRESLTVRANAAIERAFALDPANVLAWHAKAVLLPTRNHWLQKEKIIRQGLALNPGNFELTGLLGRVMLEVGRGREAIDLIERAHAARPAPDIGDDWVRIQALWGAGRIPEADQAMVEGDAEFPRNVSIWFSRLYVLLYTGRAREAAALVADADNRPTGVPDLEFETDAIVAQAVVSGAKPDIDKAVAASLAMAAEGAGLADNAMQFLSAIGRVDEAFAIADALYFGRGMPIGVTRYSVIQGDYVTLENRRLWPLFLPSTRAMRKDARFEPLIKETGLPDYWKATGSMPDYRRYPEPA